MATVQCSSDTITIYPLKFSKNLLAFPSCPDVPDQPPLDISLSVSEQYILNAGFIKGNSKSMAGFTGNFSRGGLVISGIFGQIDVSQSTFPPAKGEPLRFVVIVRFTTSSPTGSLVIYDEDDTYEFLIIENDSGTNNVNLNITVTFSRVKRQIPDISLDRTIGLLLLSSGKTEEFQVPSISLIGQTLIDGSDMGDIIFTIGDQFTYYSDNPLKNTTCNNYFLPIDQIQTTIYRQYCPKMVTVVKGKGLTLY